jgi:hypothetical protein
MQVRWLLINGIDLGTIKFIKSLIMKKLMILAIAGFTFACNNGSQSSTASADTTGTDTAKAAMAPAPDSSSVASQPALKDSLMTIKDGKMMIVKSGAWVAMDATVTCTNGRKVSVDGVVLKKDKKRKLEEGMMIDKDGQIMDKNGKLMDTSGWD